MSDQPAEPVPGSTPHRRRPRLLLPAVVIAALLLVTGVLVAVLGYRETSGPEGVVRAYFDALQRGDAADALALGDVPDESRVLLSSQVLDEQRRIAPIEDVDVTGVRKSGARAQVDVQYTLNFPGADRPVTTRVRLRQVDGDWRLERAAVPTELQVAQAAQRATVLGHRLPTGTVLVFPGAVPIGFDTDYLQLVPGRASVSFDSASTTQVIVEPSRAGKRAAIDAIGTALRQCLAGRVAVTCPQPTERYVPGSVRGAVVGPLASVLHVVVGDGATGTLEVSGRVPVRGSYRILGFDNRQVTRHEEFELPLRARSYAVAPLRTMWMRSG